MVAPSPSDESQRPSSQSTLSDSLVGQVAAARQPTRGSTIGRYVILDRVGAGGMGVVYAGYDPDLDRKVAIKVLLPASDVAPNTSGRARLLREAQALAKLAHPNVVAIHDVGTLDDEVWIAMEFVAGRTLAGWLDKDHPWTRVLDVVVAAASGVAAAHAAGLLHRDLKPDNVMLGDDGRVRVMDFGLARAHDDGSSSDAQALVVRDPAAVNVTHAGALIGTPAYMAPELFDQRPASTASDQFSLCVTLWEALYGRRPFAGNRANELAASLLESSPLASSRPVPAWLRRVVERGLAIDPDARWPSVGALLDALAAGRARARRRGPIAASLAVAALLGASFGGVHVVRRARLAECDRAGAELDAQWPGRRNEINRVIADSGLAYAATTIDRLHPWLEDHVTRWRAARTEACVAATVDDELDAQQSRDAQTCLTLDARHLQSFLDMLARGDKGALRSAVMVATDLPPPEDCLDRLLLASTPWPAPEQVDQVAELDTVLAHSSSLALAGDLREATELGELVIAEARELAWPPLLARAQSRQGWKLSDLDRHAEGEALLREAYFGAARASAWLEAAGACSGLVRVLGRLGRSEDARTWAEHGVTMLALGGAEEGLQRAALDRLLSTVERNAGAGVESERLARRSLAITEQQLGSDHPAVAEALERIGNVVQGRGDDGEAADYHRRALAIRERVLGADHPDVGTMLNNLAVAEHALGNDDGAAALCERSIAILDSALGPNSAVLAASLSTLADIYRAQGRFGDAERLLRRALAIEVGVLGEDHYEVAATLLNLSSTLGMTGAHDEAAALLERALAIVERRLPPGHPQIGITLASLANARHQQARDEEAESLYQRALDLLRETDSSPRLLHLVWTGLAEVQRSRGHIEPAARTIADALEHVGTDFPVERAAVLGERAEIELAQGHPRVALTTVAEALDVVELPTRLRGELGFVAARALLAAGDRTAALERGRDALLELRAGAARADEIAALERWLADQGAAR